ncbi:MAG: tetratricopeptide repeat protein [Chthoniobacterales bacterium]|nr:tetratricopeptide repeat protein [Chthoniobacterales bacterium]
MNLRNFFAELKRRNVYKVAVAYAVVAWLVIQISDTVFPRLNLPDWAVTLVIVLLLLGFPVALIFAWAFELTPEGIKRTEDVAPGESITRTTGRKLTVLVATIAVIAVGLLLLQLFRDKTQPPSAASATTAAPSGSPEKSIAVLPFESLSEDKANAYFATGVQDEILTRLAKVGDLKVISRTSTQQYQSKPGNVAEIAKQLGVSHVLEGSVQKAGDSVRVNVQLIKAETDAHLWAETYDGKLTDIFAVQSDVARRIADSLEAKLTGREQQQIAAVPTKNPQAYDAYLRGLAFIIRESPDDVRKAREFFQEAVALDPTYAQAWSQLSIASSQLYFSDERTPAELENSRRAAETAVRLQPDLSDAHSALALFYYFCLQDFDRALVELEEARQRSPNDGNAIFYTGLVKRRQGKLNEAIELQKKATVFDPRNPDMWANLARSYRGKRDFRAAREMFDRAFAISPDETDFIGSKAETFFAEGDLDAAEKLLGEQSARAPGKLTSDSVTYLVYRRRFDDAVQLLSKQIEENKNGSRLRQADEKSWLGSLKILAGQQGEGRALIEEARRELIALREQGNTATRLTVAVILSSADLGDRAEVERTAAELLRQAQRDLWSGPWSQGVVAAAYAMLGDADRAIPLLQHCLAVPHYRAITPALLRIDPVWDKIRNDARFQQLAGTQR